MGKTNPYPEVKQGLFSVYEFKRFGEDSKTPCGRVVPLYCLVRVAGPYPTARAAAWIAANHGSSCVCVAKPDTGPLWSFETEEA